MRLSRWQRLRWKLTLSYVLVTTATLLVIEIAFAAVLFLFINPLRDTRIPKPELQLISAALARLARDDIQAADSHRLEDMVGWLFPDSSGLIVLVSDPEHNIRGLSAATKGWAFDEQEFPGLADLLASSLAGQEDSLKLYVTLPDNRMMHTVPITAADGTILGALAIIVTPSLLAPRLILMAAAIILLSLSAITLITAAIGIPFGVWSSRGLSNRLAKLAVTADAWSTGDLLATVNDTAEDELALLANHLNRMAVQIHDLMRTNQELAAAEARNHIARDLHDSVKQQIFAVSMQLGTATTLIDVDQPAAKAHLLIAASLVQQAQQELNLLIQDMRPSTLPIDTGRTTLGNYVDRWAQQNNLAAEIQIQPDLVLPASVSNAYFRIVQEALSNIARHSQATAIAVALKAPAKLIIRDNGCGFDPDTVTHGMGLRSMQERIESLGGSWMIDSQPGGGTTLTALLDEQMLENQR
jgi:two-component system, NarL family, sensor histidine kinase LiaS